MEATQVQATQVSDAVGSTSTGIDPSTIQVAGSEPLEQGGEAGGEKPLQEDISPNDSVAKQDEIHIHENHDGLDWGLVFTFFKFTDAK